MKNFKRIVIAIIALVVVAAPASAQFRFGIKGGVNVNSMHFTESGLKDVLDSENRTGFTGGITTEFTIPVIGLGFDASVMYVHRVSNVSKDTNTTATDNPLAGILPSTDRDYIEIPINLKYKLNLPVVSNFLVPYVFGGPSFAVLCSKKQISDAWKNKSAEISLNIGLGVQVLSHVQVGASYGFGLTNTMEYIGDLSQYNNEKVGKNNGWTVTAAYFF